MLRNLLILSLLPMLAGCIAQSRIQEKYMSQESTCRDEAQDRATNLPNAYGRTDSGQPSDTAYIVASVFSDCMHKAGWKVSTPKPPGTPVGPVVVVDPPSGSPGPGGTVASIRPATTAQTPSAPIIGPGVQPSPAPASTAVPQKVLVPPTVVPQSQVVTPPPSTVTYPSQSGVSVYQPAPAVPDYGQNAGRRF